MFIIFFCLFFNSLLYSSQSFITSYKSYREGYLNFNSNNPVNCIVKKYKTHDPYHLHLVYRNGRPVFSHTKERTVVFCKVTCSKIS